MISTYEEYLPMSQSLTFEEMVQTHHEMLSELGNDEDALELYEELISAANKYSVFRSNWCVWSREEKIDKDPSRTSCHNSLIVKFNQLARFLRMQGKAAAWRDALGYEEDNPYYRKRLGDFACYIVFINSVNAR